MFDQPIEMDKMIKEHFELAFQFKDKEEIKLLNQAWWAIVRGMK